MESIAIHIENLDKSFSGLRGTTDVLRNITLSINPGEFFVLLGPSGCGKSTLLNILAGLEKPTQGRIDIGDTTAVDTHTGELRSPFDRDVAMVFQSYALYPHMTVRKNLRFPLTNIRPKYSKEVIETKIQTTAKLLQIDNLLDRKPSELSGGQRQRVAIGRAIIREPKLFLMDEPLSNLDAQLRTEMRAHLKELQKRLSITTIYVTHDQIEAMTLGDRIAILHNGILQQVGSPTEVYDKPENAFVAGFIGSPPMNLIRGKLKKHDNTVTFTSSAYTFELPATIPRINENIQKDECILGIRPEHISISTPGNGNGDVSLSVVENIGSEYLLYAFQNGDKPIIIKTKNVNSNNDRVSLQFQEDKIYLL